MAAGPESQRGFLERFSYFTRNIEIGVAVVAGAFGYLGVATLSAIGAGIDHAMGKYFENRRMQKARGG